MSVVMEEEIKRRTARRTSALVLEIVRLPHGGRAVWHEQEHSSQRKG